MIQNQKQKQFTIIFDDKKKELATILNTLVSEVEEVKNIEHSMKKYKKEMAVTDKECVLFLGKEASVEHRLNFKDKYSKYGIHLGYRGAKAWIYCEKYRWNKKVYKEFHDELMQLYKDLDMNPCKVEEFVSAGMKDYAASGSTIAPVGSSLVQKIMWNSVVTSSIAITAYTNPISWLYYKVSKWVKSLFAESHRIDQQYRFAIGLFFRNYLKDYMKIVVKEEIFENPTQE